MKAALSWGLLGGLDVGPVVRQGFAVLRGFDELGQDECVKVQVGEGLQKVGGHGLRGPGLVGDVQGGDAHCVHKSDGCRVFPRFV